MIAIFKRRRFYLSIIKGGFNIIVFDYTIVIRDQYLFFNVLCEILPFIMKTFISLKYKTYSRKATKKHPLYAINHGGLVTLMFPISNIAR